ncbi:MAG: hypothetical protein V5A39_01660 [Haloarculaceae archaeon]|jgi:hypothetical protein
MTQMGDIDHTNPYTDDPFVQTYRRGQIVAADGGERDATEDEEDPDKMEDVPHTSPNDGTNRTFERGKEGRDESV